MAITKYDILVEQAQTLMEQALKAQRIVDGLDAQTNSCGPCSCGEDISDEGKFARHFVISYYNRQMGFLNLGECPNSDKGKAIIRNAQANEGILI